MNAPDTLETVLDLLADAGGAILWWLVPEGLAEDFEAFSDNGQITLDSDTDCYVHPDAKRDGDGYTMRGERS